MLDFLVMELQTVVTWVLRIAGPSLQPHRTLSFVFETGPHYGALAILASTQITLASAS